MDQGSEGSGRAFRRTALAAVSSEPDGTIVLRFDAECRLDAAASAEVVAAHVELAGGARRPVLVDMRGMISSDRESRELAAGPEVTAATSRLAILVESPVSRVIGNFFLRVTSPRYPTQLFNEEALARAWLREG